MNSPIVTLLALLSLPLWESILANNVPNMMHIIREIEREHRKALSAPGLRDLARRQAHWSNLKPDDIESWEFADRVVQKLHSINPRFGYGRAYPGRSNSYFMTDFVVYFQGSGNPQGTVNDTEGTLEGIDYLTVNRQRAVVTNWYIVEEVTREGHEGDIEWVYPRPGAPNYGYDPDYPGPVVGDTEETTTTTVTIPSIIRGQCGSWQGPSDQSCTAGTFHNHPGHTDTRYRWTCRNIPHEHDGQRREDKCDKEKNQPPLTSTPSSPTSPPSSSGLANTDTLVPLNEKLDLLLESIADIQNLTGTQTGSPPPLETQGQGHQEILAIMDEKLDFLLEATFGIYDFIHTEEVLFTPIEEVSVCPQDKVPPDYEEIGEQCLPSCEKARELHCAKNTCRRISLRRNSLCQFAQSSSFYQVVPLESYEEICCLIKMNF